MKKKITKKIQAILLITCLIFSGFAGIFPSPTVAVPIPVQKIAEGFGHTLAIKADGTLWGWGMNTQGQLGQGTAGGYQTIPVQIGTDNNWAQVAAGSEYSVAIKTDGTLWAWGINTTGELGTGDTSPRYAPVKIGTYTDWTAISVWRGHTLALRQGGTLWAWGNNANGQLGINGPSYLTAPTQVGTDTWQSVSAGNDHSLGIQSNGTLWAWGSNMYGELGTGLGLNSSTPVQIGAFTDWIKVSASDRNSSGLRTGGTLWVWGDNTIGQLGDGTTVPSNIPKQVPGTWSNVTTGQLLMFATKTDNTLWCWGFNTDGQLGDGTSVNHNTPTLLNTVTGLVDMQNKGSSSLALKSDGTVWATGRNDVGQFGDDTFTNSATWKQIRPDFLPPAWPTSSLTAANVTSTDLTLNWNPASDFDGIASYQVYQNGTPVATVPVPTCNITGLSPNIGYGFKVEAVDNNGNWSNDGPSVAVTTPAVGAGPATKLVWATQPGNAQAGVNLSQQPVLYLEDDNNYIVTSHPAATVSLSLTNSGGATLGGTTTVSLINGVATFTNLSVDLAGSYTLTPATTLPSIYCPDSNPFSITVNAPTVISTILAGGTTGMLVDSNIEVYFSENVQYAPNFSGIFLKKSGTTVVDCTYSLAGYLNINPTSNLDYSTLYTVTIPAGSLLDLDSNPIAEYTFQFTTQPAPGAPAYKLAAKWPALPQPWYFNNPSGVAVDSSNNIYVVDSTNNRIQKFASDGTFMTKWGSLGTADGQFNNPLGIAIDQADNVYVTDTSNNRVQKFDSGGAFIGQWGSYGSETGQFQNPWGLFVTTAGYVYVADTYNHRIQEFDSEGNFVNSWGSGGGNGQFNLPRAVTIDQAGNMYVADTGNNRIQKFDSTGAYLTQWGTTGSGDGQFDKPQAITTDQTGNVYVADVANNRIEIFDSGGTYLSQWGGLANGQFYNPQGITIDHSGNFYITDLNDRIQKFNSGGTFLTQWKSGGNDANEFINPRGIFRDQAGNFLVTDTGNNRIQKLDPAGNFINQWGSSGNASGQFDYPAEISEDPSGNIYIVDSNNNRVQKFAPDGTFITQWGSLGNADGQFLNPWGITVDQFAYVYVTDAANDRIQKFDSEGNFITKWGSYGTNDGQFDNPRGIFADQNGFIYVGDAGNNRIQKFDTDGNFITKLGSVGSNDGQFQNPDGGIYVDQWGDVYVADTANSRIQKFTPDGGFITKWGSTGSDDGQFSYPGGISGDPSGNIYVVDIGNNRIQQFATTSPAVTFPDPEMEAAVRNVLNKFTGAVTQADMATLTDFSALETGISNLTGLQYAINLKSVDLSWNEITDLSPLSGLTKLKSLHLEDNMISFLQPLDVLYQNGGLVNGSVYLAGNFIDTTVNNAAYNLLQNLSSGGVYIDTYPQNINNDITYTDPLPNSAGVNIGTDINITFRDTISASNLDNVSIAPVGGGPVNYNYSITGNVLTLKPAGLQENTPYIVTIRYGAVTFPDYYYNSPYSFNFITQTAAPSSGPRMAYIPNFGDNSVTVVDIGTQSVVKTIYGLNQPWAVAVNPKGNRVYVTNLGNNSISVINPLSNTIMSTVYGITDPRGAALSPDGTRLYIANYSADTVLVIDTASNQLIGSPITVGANPLGIVVSPDGTQVYVANSGSDYISIIDTSNNAVSARSVGTNPYGLDVTPDGSQVYVTNNGSSFVSVINTGNQLTGTIDVGLSNRAIVVSPDGKRVYTANYDTGKISVIDTCTNTVTGFIYAGTNPNGISVSPGGGLLAVANYGSNNLSVFATNPLILIDTVQAGTNPAAFGKSIKMFPPRRVYIPNSAQNTVSIIDAYTDGIDTTVDTAIVGTGPYAVAITPDDWRAYVTNYESNTVSVIDVETNKVITSIPVGPGPAGVAVNPQGTRVYVADYIDNSITVIDTSNNSVVSTINLPENSFPQGIMVSPGGGRIYTANPGNNTVSIINTVNNTVENTVYGFSQPRSFAAVGDGSYVYVTNSGSNTVSMLDTRKQQVVGTVYVGSNPYGIASTPDGTRLFVANYGNNTVTVIDAAYHLNNVIISIGLGSELGPVGIAVTPDGKQIYVVNSGSNTVSLISTTDYSLLATFNVGINPTALGQFIGPGLKAHLTPPAVKGAIANGYKVKLSYDRILDETVVPGINDFSVYAGASPVAVNDITILGTRVDLTLTTPVISGQSMTLSYTPGTKPVQEVAGQTAAGFTNLNVWTNTPVLQTAYAKDGSSQLDLYYNEPLDATYVPGLTDYTVTVNGVKANVSNVQVINQNVYITIDQSLSAGQTVVLAYTPGTTPLRDLQGVLAAPVSSIPVEAVTLPFPVGSYISGVTINGPINVPFNQNISEGYDFSSIVLHDSTHTNTIPSSFSISGSNLIVSPTTSLNYDTSYFVVIPAGAIANKQGYTMTAQFTYGITTELAPPPPPITDITPPNWSGVTLHLSNKTPTGTTLSWTPPYDPDDTVASYSVYANGALIGSTPSTSYDITGLTPNNVYTLSVCSVDFHGNWSTDLNISFSTSAPSWLTPYLEAVGITSTGLTLNWTSADDPFNGIVAYSVYQDDNPVALDTVDGLVNTYNIIGLSPGSPHFFRIEAMNSLGLWSTGGPTISATTLPAPDNTLPTVLMTNPSNNVSSIPVNQTITIAFSEPIKQGPAFSGIAIQTGATVVSFTYNISGSTLTLTPINNFSYLTPYTIVIPAGAVQDYAYNTLANNSSFNFTTMAAPDTTGPTVLTALSTNGNTNVHSHDKVTIRFSENIMPSTSISSISITSASGTAAVSYSYNITGDTLTLTPTSGLQTATTYYVTIPAGTVTDYSYNSLASSYKLSFITSLFGDANLENRVRAALSMPAGDIDLTKLTVLNAIYSSISDLTGLQGATNLKQLYLGYNSISDLTPLAGLTSLEDLWLDHNQISNVSSLSGLTNLRWLYLSNNQISSIDPLSGLSSLEALDLNNNIISNVTLPGKLTSLWGLGLANNNISDISGLSTLTNLQSLDLQAQKNTAAKLSNISAVAKMPYLRNLLLNDNNIMDLTPLQNLTNLKFLTLWNNGITDAVYGGITPLSGLSGLTDLWLDKNNIINLAPLAGLTKLQVVSLAGNNYINSISSLKNNAGLGDGDYVYLPSAISPAVQSDVDTLVNNKKVKVIYR